MTTPTFHLQVPVRALPAIRETVALNFGFITERVIDGQQHIVAGNVSPRLFEAMRRAIEGIVASVKPVHLRVAKRELLSQFTATQQ